MIFSFRFSSVIGFLFFFQIFSSSVLGQSTDQAISDMELQANKYGKEGNVLEIARCQTKLGFLYKEKNNFNKAIEFFQKAIKSNEDLGNLNAVKNLCVNIGMLSAELNNYDQALLYFKKSYRINEKQGKNEEMVADLINIGLTLQSLHNYSESNQSLELAVSKAQETSNMASLKNCYAMLSENYDKLGNQTKSRDYFELASSIKSHIQKEEIKQFESRTHQAEAEITVKEGEIKSKDQKIQKISKEQQLTLQLLQQQKELSDLKEKDFQAKERFQKAKQRYTYYIILSMGFIIFLVSFSLFFIFKQLREKKKAFTLLEDSNHQITEQKKEIEVQRDIATNQKKKITDSIYYAQRIQNAVLPPVSLLEKVMPEHFVLFRPRDIVSGDFYWMTEKDGIAIIVAADCTGHGVPGAFMSMLGVAFLNDIVNKITFNKHFSSLHANEILNQLREYIINSLHQTGKSAETKDGMDIALCIVDFEHKHMQFSGAHNSLYLIRDGQLEVIEADKMPIGIYKTADTPFTNHEISLEKNDLLYIFSDGYYDQFGGSNNMKMFSANFRKRLVEICKESLPEQKRMLEEYYDNWKGSREQVDDVLVIGFKFEPQTVVSSVPSDYLWHNKKILIADDVDINYFLLVEALKSTKVMVFRAENGFEAVEYCRSNDIDLVLMDIRMPVMDGIEATKLIRSFKPNLPIIAQTALGEEGDREMITSAGCDDYISKPINLKLFLSVVRNHLIK
jgi:CheY-like chemotaxis protein/serine phosphatase RsbU (regulator of sigma subunit)